MVAKILFKNEEILKAFEKLYKSDPKDKLSFQIEIDAISNHVKTHLVNSKYSIEMKRYRNQMWEDMLNNCDCNTSLSKGFRNRQAPLPAITFAHAMLKMLFRSLPQKNVDEIIVAWC